MILLVLSYQFVFLFGFQLFVNFLKMAFSKKRVQKLGFSIFSVLSLNFQIVLFLALLKHYKNKGFSNFFGFSVVEGEEIGKKKR